MWVSHTVHCTLCTVGLKAEVEHFQRAEWEQVVKKVAKAEIGEKVVQGSQVVG